MPSQADHSAQPDPKLVELRERERLTEIREMLFIATGQLAMPLYLMFWLCDLIYAPEHKWLFLALRSSVIGLCVVTRRLTRQATSVRRAEWICCLYAFGCGIAITAMTFVKDGPLSPYYAGLNLVCVGLLFLPVSAGFLFLNIASIFAPYYLGQVYLVIRSGGAAPLAVHTFFVSSTIIITVVIGMFFRRLRAREVESRFLLEQEIASRDHIIRQKTNEAVRLSALSAQFSPQVVHMIRQGRIEIDEKVRTEQVCAIFIDVVGSTERVTKIDKQDVNMVISMFMDDAIKELLKYDITIDKFLGDGILAFSNSPVQYDDYVERVLLAALEVRALISSRAVDYEQLWRKPFSLRMGVASGLATVGFYGNKKYFKTFTAIGPCVNLASRLCGVGEPGDVLVSGGVAEVAIRTGFRVTPRGEQTLKGFEAERVRAFSLEGAQGAQISVPGELDCPKCRGIMHVVNQNGIYGLQCRNCEKTVAESPKADVRRVA